MNLEINCQLIKLTNRIQQDFDNAEYRRGIYVEFNKALDTVKHNVLLAKLSHYGVRGTGNYFKYN